MEKQKEDEKVLARRVQEKINSRNSAFSIKEEERGSFIRSKISEPVEKEIVLKIITCNLRRTVVLINSIFILIISRFSVELISWQAF